MTKVGFLYTRLRVEEKCLLDELEKHEGVEVVRINDGDSFFDVNQLPQPVDVLFERSISYSRGLYISRIFEAHGVPVVNSSAVAERCGDKYITSQILAKNGIPTPQSVHGFRRRISSQRDRSDGLSMCAETRCRVMGTSARKSG